MPIELRKKVGQNIRSLRNKKKLTQETLAFEAEIEYKYLQMIEGKNPPNISLKVIEKLSKALKVSPSKLLSTP